MTQHVRAQSYTTLDSQGQQDYAKSKHRIGQTGASQQQGHIHTLIAGDAPASPKGSSDLHLLNRLRAKETVSGPHGLPNGYMIWPYGLKSLNTTGLWGCIFMEIFICGSAIEEHDKTIAHLNPIHPKSEVKPKEDNCFPSTKK